MASNSGSLCSNVVLLRRAAAAERLDRALTCIDHPPEAADLDALEHHLNAVFAETK